MIKDPGYNKFLFILPFDHRSTFEKGMFGIEERDLTPKIIEKIKEEKQIIYAGFKKAVSEKIPKEFAGLLVDEEFGEDILKDAVALGFITILTTEKSGQKEFSFEYGDQFGSHIKQINPIFAKALLRFNPQDSGELKKKQARQLKKLSDFCHENGFKFLLEVLIEPTSEQLDSVGADKGKFDSFLRPKLACEVIVELQDLGVEPDVWKMEGVEKEDDYKLMVSKARRDKRDNVSIVILGRGEEKEVVDKWIKEGAGVSGIIGFAVGRTIFWEPLLKFKNKKISEEQTAEEISNNFIYYYNLFMSESAI